MVGLCETIFDPRRTLRRVPTKRFLKDLFKMPEVGGGGVALDI